MHSAQITLAKLRFRRIKIYEAIIFYFATSAFWHYVFSSLLDQLPNMTYLEYPVMAATAVQLTKWLDPLDTSPQVNFFGTYISRSSLLEIFFVATISIGIGIGAWSLTVFFEANIISPHWSYHFWDLIDANSFNSIKWSRSWLAADMIAVALVGPISEEIIFRGLILKSLLKKYSVRNAVLTSSTIFALFHCNHNFLGTFLHSILFSILAIRLSSLYAPIIAHSLYNFFVTILRSTCGISLVADRAQIDKFSYWQIDLLLLIAGLSLGSAYVYIYMKNQRFKSTPAAHSQL